MGGGPDGGTSGDFSEGGGWSGGSSGDFSVGGGPEGGSSGVFSVGFGVGGGPEGGSSGGFGVGGGPDGGIDEEGGSGGGSEGGSEGSDGEDIVAIGGKTFAADAFHEVPFRVGWATAVSPCPGIVDQRRAVEWGGEKRREKLQNAPFRRQRRNALNIASKIVRL